MRNRTILSLTKDLKNIIENCWWIMVAPDYMQFLFLLIFDNELCRYYLNIDKEIDNV